FYISATYTTPNDVTIIYSTRRTRRSIPFPYTTLFRSVHVDVAAVVALDDHHAHAGHHRAGGVRAVCAGGDQADLTLRLTAVAMVDRKSTRLNSSHVKISYAVFCLKKKNKQSCKL